MTREQAYLVLANTTLSINDCKIAHDALDAAGAFAQRVPPNVPYTPEEHEIGRAVTREWMNSGGRGVSLPILIARAIAAKVRP